MKTSQTIDTKLVRRLERAYDRAIRAEENAATERQAYRLAAVSERCLRQLQAARAGLPLPEARLPRTARNLAKQGLAALATFGRAVARALQCAAALRKAQAVNAAARVARGVARLVRQALRRAGRAVACRALALVPVTTKKEIIVMQAPKLAARVHAGQGHNYCQVSVDGYDGFHTDSVDGGGGVLQYSNVAAGFALRTELRGDRFVFTGGPHGDHSLAADELITNAARLLAHWKGYCENADQFYASVCALIQHAHNGAEVLS